MKNICFFVFGKYGTLKASYIVRKRKDGMDKDGKWAYIKYISALLLFGSNGVVASHIALDSYEIVLLRTAIGSAFLLMLFLLTKGQFTFWHQKRAFVFLLCSGVAMGGNWLFLYEAFQQIGVGMATLACYCGPVFVMILSPILFKTRLTWLKVVGFFIVIGGMLLINGHLLQAGYSGWGLFCGIMSAVMYALLVICNKKAAAIAGLENALLQLASSFVTVAIFVAWKQGVVLQIAHGDWLPILFLGLLNTGIGCYLYFSSLGVLPVQTVAVCGYLEPLSAVIFSVLLLGETMTAVQWFGAGMILGGAMLSELTILSAKGKRTTCGDVGNMQ